MLTPLLFFPKIASTPEGLIHYQSARSQQKTADSQPNCIFCARVMQLQLHENLAESGDPMFP